MKARVAAALIALVPLISVSCDSLCSRPPLAAIAPVKGDKRSEVVARLGPPDREQVVGREAAAQQLQDRRIVKELGGLSGGTDKVTVSIWERRCGGRVRQRMTVLVDPLTETVAAAETVFINR